MSTVDDKKKKPETYRDYYDLQKKYAKEYADRGEFKYDVNADEIYKIYREQAEKSAEAAQRHTTAQAAGLTGGYGSSYATAAGAQAYSDVMGDVDAMIPELYEAARARYDREGEDLLKRAEAAGAYGDMLYSESDDYAAYLQEMADAETAKRVHRMGNNAKEGTVYSAAMNYLLNNGKDKDELEKELAGWKYAANDEGVEEYLTPEDVEYIVRKLIETRAYNAAMARRNSEGTLSEYVDRLIGDNKSYDEAYAALEAWRDSDGEGLTAGEIEIMLKGVG